MSQTTKKPEAGPSPNWHGNLYLPTAFILSPTVPPAHTRDPKKTEQDTWPYLLRTEGADLLRYATS